ncbi:omega-amidase, chloroplastic-like [Beta vulgaris subsp. vulgaris]|uniref:omega-amidase, chloroplastic-like n=1 Tax=Beta vulgaris subsp. vulgaris TaxID=3555 RepID=UPI002549526F|nr:omega-amidase, chloroplastic-like [Beta vulgaris subsp. vulgaris]
MLTACTTDSSVSTGRSERNGLNMEKSFQIFQEIVASLPPVILAFKIGLCQLSVTADKARNIDHARKAIEDAAQKGAKLVVLLVSLHSVLLILE